MGEIFVKIDIKPDGSFTREARYTANLMELFLAKVQIEDWITERIENLGSNSKTLEDST